MNSFLSRTRLLGRTGTVLVAASLALGVLSSCAESKEPAAAPSAPARTVAPDSTLHTVSNGGRRLAFQVTPGRLPAIVLDAGGGNDSSYWKRLVPALAKKTGSMIITYDRAGMGASDDLPGPWNVQAAVSDLEAGLTQLGFTRDLVLVSHSIAGEVATNFANKNPGWLTGAVLVDANVPPFYTDEEVAKIDAGFAEQVAELKKQKPTKQTRQLLAVAENYGEAHRAYHRLTWPNAVPLTVIVSAKTPFDTLADAQLWRDAQAQYVAAAPNRKLVVADNSSHDVPLDRPDLVINAVEQWTAFQR